MAPFRLRFDADHFDMLVTKGLVDPTKYSEAAENFRQIATYMNSNECTLDWNDDVSKRLRRTRVKSLPGDMVCIQIFAAILHKCVVKSFDCKVLTLPRMQL